MIVYVGIGVNVGVSVGVGVEVALCSGGVAGRSTRVNVGVGMGTVADASAVTSGRATCAESGSARLKFKMAPEMGPGDGVASGFTSKEVEEPCVA